MAFNVAANLLMPNWGKTAGDNIRRNRQDAKAEEQQNMLAQALPAALQGDANALAMVAQADPGVYAQLENTRYTRDQAAAKKTTEDAEKREKQFFGKTAAGIASIFQTPAEQRPAAWSAWVAPIKAEYGDDADDLPDAYDEGTVRTLAFDLAAHDKAYGDLLSRTGALPQEPANAPEAPPSVREYEYAKKQGFPGTLADYEMAKRRAGASTNTVSFGAPVAGRDANGNEVFIRPDNQGGMTIVPGVKPPARSDQAPTEDQAKAAGWYKQAANAYQNIETVLQEDPKAAQPDLIAETLDMVPVLGESMKNKRLTPGQQRYQQAISSFSEAVLRAATGAGVNRDEALQKVRELTPRPGEDAATVAQKKRSMNVYLDSLQTRASRALKSDEILQVNTPPDPAGRKPLSAFGG